MATLLTHHQITYRPNAVRVAIAVSKKEMSLWPLSKLLWTNKNIAYGFIPYQAVGGLFGGYVKHMKQFVALYEKTKNELISDELVTIEQCVIALMIKKYPDLFDIPVTCMSYNQLINEIFNQKLSIKLWGNGSIKRFDRTLSVGT